MRMTGEFVELVQRPDPPLDLGAALIAQHAHPSVDRRTILHALDSLAAGVTEHTTAGLVEHLFTTEHFAGNVDQYYEPANSYLDDVLARRTGIPITLAVVTLEVGRRIGVPLAGVGLPGHFVVRDLQRDDTYLDVFDRGRELDVEGCERLLSRMEGRAVDLHPAWLAPVDHRSILWRMLGNLKIVHAHRNDAVSLAWVLELRCAFPDVPDTERDELVRVRRHFN